MGFAFIFARLIFCGRGRSTHPTSCVLQVIHGESDTTNDAGRRSHRFQLYFPELMIIATAVDAEPIVDSLSTVFSEIKPVN